MRELVLFEVSERDDQIVAERIFRPCIEGGRELLEQLPTESRVSDFVGVNLREEIAERSVRHLETLGADERDGDRLTETTHADDVAKQGLERVRCIAMTRVGRRIVDLRMRLSA